MKRLLLVVLTLLPLGLFAEALTLGMPIHSFAFKDQFEKTLSPTPQTKQIIIAFSKAQGEIVKTFLEAHPHYLHENNALYLMDASEVPGMVLSMFMLPKFKKYPYSIGLIQEEKDVALFPKKEDHITILTLENNTITGLEFKQTL
ncbi:MAG: hypothetical protein PHN18_09005 [Sulfurospirillaceae bacterium]|jgi:hypothetical protein|nr:hypothetical protein [Sulfurospirillaceae bacterium]MDD2826751.1 hypothetical protein [Sulfurospirillaceae bacterium]